MCHHDCCMFVCSRQPSQKMQGVLLPVAVVTLKKFLKKTSFQVGMDDLLPLTGIDLPAVIVNV